MLGYVTKILSDRRLYVSKKELAKHDLAVGDYVIVYLSKVDVGKDGPS
jgi:hypothetical protein